MKLFKKDYKKYFIQCIFLIPLFTCLLTAIGVKSFVDYHISATCANADTGKVFFVILCVLFINAVMSFIALVSYYCLENRVEDIVKKRAKHEKQKN